MASPSVWKVYLIRTVKNTLYTGITTDVARRYREHASGKGAKYFRSFPPCELVGEMSCASRSEALRLEARVKKLRPADKIALIKQHVA